MLRYSIVFLLCFFSGIVKAQEFAVINDPDGYVNVRAAKNIKAKVIAKLYDGQIFYYDQDKVTDKWYGVYCSPGQYINYPDGKLNYPKRSDIKGFVSADRILPIRSMSHPSLSVKNRKITSSSLTINWNTLTVIVNTKGFKSTAHKIIGDKAVPALEIDGKHPYGQDGGVPNVEIAAIRLKLRDKVIEIPHHAFSDLYDPNLGNWNIYHDKKGTYYVMSRNSDGAGGYDLIFVVKNGKFVGRYIDQP